jgi:hypothetical protein
MNFFHFTYDGISGISVKYDGSEIETRMGQRI